MTIRRLTAISEENGLAPVERCLLCHQLVLDGDGLVRTDQWVAHMGCVMRWRLTHPGKGPQA